MNGYKDFTTSIDLPPLNLRPRGDEKSVSPDGNLLSAVLTCLGAQVSEEDLARVQTRQNPFGQKRGGLGFGGFFSVKPVQNQRNEWTGGVPAGIVNVNLFARQQAARSPISMELLDEEARFLRFKLDGEVVATGSVPAAPGWLGRTLVDGTSVAKIVQVHGPNLVSVWGNTRCVLFDRETACSFCMFDGATNNSNRSMEQVIEAIKVMRSTEVDRNRHNNLTLTTGFLEGEEVLARLARDIALFKEQFPGFKLALETTPLNRDDRPALSRLKEAGLDTLMIPLDCASLDAQAQFLKGKAALLQRDYWATVEEAVEIFPPNNVTSSIIVGLEPQSVTVEAMKRMAQKKVVPEPLPVRWDDSRYDLANPPPLTDPLDLISVREELDLILASMSKGAPLAGCAACGGCSGLKKKSV